MFEEPQTLPVKSALELHPQAPSVVLHPTRESRLVFDTDPSGLAVERYKMLRRRLCALRSQGGLILITSPSPCDGKTLTSVNLAWCLAEAGHKTCLVDLDFRAPGVGFALQADPPDHGLAEVLAGTCTLNNALTSIGQKGLQLLGIAQSLESPTEQLRPDAIRPLMSKLRESFEWVILDMAPVIPISDVGEVLPFVDGAILVVRAGKTQKSLIGPSLEVIGTKLLGAVLNDVVVQGSAYYGNYGYGAERKRNSRR